MCNYSAFLSHTDNTSFFFLPISFAGFNEKIMKVCGDIMGVKPWESFQGPLTRRYVQLPTSFSGISLVSMEDYALFAFLRRWALMAPYLCLRFHIFNGPVLEEYVFQVEGHILWSCLCVVRDGLPLTVRLCTIFLRVWQLLTP
jgi:hypothetical protein